tara:strand:+ start:2754 stop:3095 length:342 start_codon:yes stop_codon:yes gene_type:complete
MKIRRKNRSFTLKGKIKLTHKADLILKNNELITFKSNDSEYDVVKKDWGYYATPSLNKRLLGFNLKTALVINKITGNLFVVLVHNKLKKKFFAYAKKENLKVLIWLNEFKTKK